MIEESKASAAVKDVPKAEEEEIPIITLKQTEKKRRPRHQRYQKGERNTVIMLDSSSDDEYDENND